MSWSEAVRVPLRTPRRAWLTAWDLGVLACANAAVIAGLWWRAGGAGDVHGVADALTSAGRLLGLLGAYFLTRNRWWEAHPFSLSAAPDGRTLRITVKALGDFSARLAAIAPGTRVIADGPY